MSFTIFAGLLIVVASFSSLFFATHSTKQWMFRNMSYLVSLSAGIFFMTAFSLSGETFELLSIRHAIFAILIGFIGMWIIHTLLPETHHHHHKGCKHSVSKNTATKILIGDSIHNTGDGIMLVMAFSISTELGIFTAISIFVHECIQEISEFFVLREAGYSTGRALLINATSASTIFIGIFLGTVLREEHAIQGFLIGITSGIFFHIVAHDLFPGESIKHLGKRSSWKHLILFLIGVLTIMGTGVIAPHPHEKESIEIE